MLFAALPIDLGVPFGGFDAVGAGVAVLLWLYLFHVIVLLAGYSATLALSSWRRSRAGAGSAGATVHTDTRLRRGREPSGERATRTPSATAAPRTPVGDPHAQPARPSVTRIRDAARTRPAGASRLPLTRSA